MEPCNVDEIEKETNRFYFRLSILQEIRLVLIESIEISLHFHLLVLITLIKYFIILIDDTIALVPFT